MLLRPQHIAARRVNWQDKAQNLREIAAELNLGLDALAFLDDNPVERQSIRTQLPEVTVIELPTDPLQYEQAIRSCAVFERLSLSAEDHERGRYYAEERLRGELQQGTANLEDFYWSLRMEAVIAPVTESTMGRVAQLTQKTNQFSMTTRRYSEQEIATMAADPRYAIHTLQVRDRFGDNGLVGVAIMRQDGIVCEIDTLVLSCRVIGRTVETALLATLAEAAMARAASVLAGWFLPTKKNAPASEVYQSHGFSCSATRDGASRWELDLTTQRITPPAWIERHIQSQGAN
jgi:FkbH-like protein